jgi:drug/metabolite transporter (DMT)-like permease
MSVKIVVEFFLLAALWGGSFLFMRIATPEFGPVALVQIRVTLALLLLLPVLIWQQKQQSLIDNAKPIFYVGLLNSAVPFVCFAFAALTLTAGYSSVTNASAPLWTALLAVLLFKERIAPHGILGLLIGFSGVMVLLWDSLVGWQTNQLLAVCAALTATLCYGVAANYTRKHLQGVSSLVITVGSLLFASIQLLPFTLFYWPESSISLDSWLSALVLALFCTGLAYILYFRLIASLGASKAITVTYFIPIFGSAFGVMFLNEEITLSMLWGGVVIILGTAITMGLVKLPILRLR